MDSTNFDNLPDEKRITILNAGLLCFSRNGYKKSSINDIANEAGVSKASIFYYFGNKENLFLYLCDYTFEKLASVNNEEIVDLFEETLKVMKNKLMTEAKHPAMYDFLELVRSQKFDDEKIYAKIDFELAKKCTTLFKNIDIKKLKDEYDVDTAINLVSWVAMSCQSQYNTTLTYEEIYQEIKKYLDILKVAIYKPEYID